MPQQDEFPRLEDLEETEGASASWEGAPFVAEDPSRARARERIQELERQTRAVSLGPAITAVVDPVLKAGMDGTVAVARNIGPALNESEDWRNLSRSSGLENPIDSAGQVMDWMGVEDPPQAFGRAIGRGVGWLWDKGTDAYNNYQEQSDRIREDQLAYARNSYAYQRAWETAYRRARSMDMPPIDTALADKIRNIPARDPLLPGMENMAEYQARLGQQEAIEHAANVWADSHTGIAHLYRIIRDESASPQDRRAAIRRLEDLQQQREAPSE